MKPSAVIAAGCALAAAFILVAAGCARQSPPTAAGPAAPQAAFFANLAALCGQAFEGRVVSTDAADRDLAAARLVMHVRECGADAIRVPFHVGDDRSRTWVISRTGAGLRLKHDHRHEDGSEDAVTQYGGDTEGPGTEHRQEFPVDTFSIDLFEREGLTASVTNVWAVELRPGAVFAYELARENRFLRVEFDLTNPVAPPPAPWGAEQNG